MKQIKISDSLYKKISDASSVVGKSTDATIRQFLEDESDAILSGNVIEIDDFETFEKLRKQAEKQALAKKKKK